MRCLKYGMASNIINVPARCDSDSANLSRESITDVISIEIRCGKNIKFCGTRQYLLESDVCNRVFNQNFSAC